MNEGIVVKITEAHIVLLTDGRFRNIPRPEYDVPMIGETYTYNEAIQPSWTAYKKYAVMVSAIMIALIGYVMLANVYQEESYLVAVDINPSIEIYTTDQMRVKHIEYLNEDGKAVVQALENKKGQLEDVLDDIVQIAVEKKYLSKQKENLIALTVVSLKNGKTPDEVGLMHSIEASLASNEVSSKITIKNSDKKALGEARAENLSINKYELLKELNTGQTHWDADDVRDKPMTDLVEEKKRVPDPKRDEQQTNRPPEKPKKDYDKNPQDSKSERPNTAPPSNSSGKGQVNPPYKGQDDDHDDDLEDIEEKRREEAEKRREDAEEKRKEQEEKREEQRKEREEAEKERQEELEEAKKEREEAEKDRKDEEDHNDNDNDDDENNDND